MPRDAGAAEREAALAMLDRLRRAKGRIRLGADTTYDVADFVRELHRRR